MRFEDIATAADAIGSIQLQPIIRSCSQFIEQSNGVPLIKNLPSTYGDVHRVKVRMMKPKTVISQSYNQAFGSDFTNLRERAVFANSTYSATTPGFEPFYVFPVNGFKFLYSREVTNSSAAYQTIVELFMETYQEAEAIDTISSLLRYTYESTNLHEGMQAGAEIILYNIAHFYAVKSASVKGYDKLLSTVTRDL